MPQLLNLIMAEKQERKNNLFLLLYELKMIDNMKPVKIRIINRKQMDKLKLFFYK